MQTASEAGEVSCVEYEECLPGRDPLDHLVLELVGSESESRVMV